MPGCALLPTCVVASSHAAVARLPARLLCCSETASSPTRRLCLSHSCCSTSRCSPRSPMKLPAAGTWSRALTPHLPALRAIAGARLTLGADCVTRLQVRVLLLLLPGYFVSGATDGFWVLAQHRCVPLLPSHPHCPNLAVWTQHPHSTCDRLQSCPDWTGDCVGRHRCRVHVRQWRLSHLPFLAYLRWDAQPELCLTPRATWRSRSIRARR